MLAARVDAFRDEINLIASLFMQIDELPRDAFWNTVFIEFIIHLRPELTEFPLVFLRLQVLFPHRNSGRNDFLAVGLRAPLETATGKERCVVHIEDGGY